MNLVRLFKYVKLINFYPPFVGAGIRLKEVSKDRYTYRIRMKKRFYNRNVYGSHYGGSLYSMCDPWYVFIAYRYFGDGYILWDKSASIRFLKPSKGTVEAIFNIPEEKLAEMKQIVDKSGKSTFDFSTFVKDEQGNKIAAVEKEIYIRKK